MRKKLILSDDNFNLALNHSPSACGEDYRLCLILDISLDINGHIVNRSVPRVYSLFSPVS